MNHNRIVILSPTETEIAPFRRLAPADLPIEITGIGIDNAIISTIQALSRHVPALIILAGIAGTYPSSNLSIAETVLVDTETTADMGSFHPDGFRAKFATRLFCPYTSNYPTFPSVHSNSVNCAGAPFIDTHHAQIENMEGAGFFRACLHAGVPFLELRTISNRVGDDPARWDIKGATLALAEALNKLIHETEAQHIDLS